MWERHLAAIAFQGSLSVHRTARKQIPVTVATCFVLALLVFGTCSVGFAGELQPVNGGPALAGEAATPERDYFQGPLKVMTLNIAHGRKTAFSQIFLSWQTIDKNLADISAVLKREDADIVALQEADGPSWWGGDFDHVALLAKKAGFSWYSRAEHMDAWALKYGTALLARKPYLETRAYRFKSSFPTPPKGFLLARFGWLPQGADTLKPVFVDVVSVHLDFSRSSVRGRQIAEMRAFLGGRKNPLIIVGDFNSAWLAGDSAVRELARQGGLQVYKPKAADLGTYGSKRMDWILISAGLEFIRYTVLPDVVSDHLGVVAVIGMKP
jgi:endonuclease/exonuclease/phosphatase family metal-dependent hydrolase